MRRVGVDLRLATLLPGAGSSELVVQFLLPCRLGIRDRSRRSIRGSLQFTRNSTHA